MPQPRIRANTTNTGIIYTTHDGVDIEIIINGFDAQMVDNSNPSTYHNYDVIHVVPQSDLLTDPAIVMENLLEEPFPTGGLFSSDIMVQTGGQSSVPGLGSVTHYILPQDNIVINVTDVGHQLYPGVVVRELYTGANGEQIINTTGVGNGSFGNLNENFADWVWQDNATRIGRESVFEDVQVNGPGAAIPISETADVPPWLSDGLSPALSLSGLNAPLFGGVGGGDPLVIDMDNSGTIDLTTLANGVRYDFLNDGYAETRAWVAASDGILVHDLDGDGLIEGVSEMFGTPYPLEFATSDWDIADNNGFVALAALDSNGDGMISSLDSAFTELQVWQDLNQDGVSQAGELVSLSAAGIASIDVSGYQLDSWNGTNNGGWGRVINGNTITHSGSVTMSDGTTREIVDAWLAGNGADTVYTGDYTLDVRTLFLPTLRGYGNMPDLHVAMSQNETLLTQVSSFVAAYSFEDLFDQGDQIRADIADILFAWAGVDGTFNPDWGVLSLRPEFQFLKVVSGLDDPFNGPWFDSTMRLPASSDASLAVRDSWDLLLDGFAARLLFQSGGAALFDAGVSYNPLTDVFEGTFALSQSAVSDLQTEAASSTDAQALWESVASFIEDTMGLTSLSTTEQGWLDSAVAATVSSTTSWSDIVTALSGVTIDGTSGDDTITGGDKDDVLGGVTGSDGNDTIYGLDGDDVIEGGNGDDHLYGGLGNDILDGGHGNDRYYYDYGHDVILKSTSSNQLAGLTDTIVLDAGITQSDLTFYYVLSSLPNQVSRNFYINVAGRGSISIQPGILDNVLDVIDQIEFSDGTTMNINALDLVYHGTSFDDALTGLAFTGTISIFGHDGNDSIQSGSGSSQIVDGGNGDDQFSLGAGNDTYIVSAGTDLINSDAGGVDRILVPEGYTLDDIHFYRTTLPGVNNAGDFQNAQIVVDGLGTMNIRHLFTTSFGVAIETLELSDGTVVDLTTQLFEIVGTDGDDFIHSPDRSEFNENDLYIFGAGNDTVVSTNGGTDTLRFGDGVTLSDITLSRAYYGGYWTALKVSDGNGNSITFSDHFTNADANFDPNDPTPGSIEYLEFFDGTQVAISSLEIETHGTDLADVIGAYDYGDLSAKDTIYAYAGNDIIYGDEGGDTVYGGQGIDTINGGAGNDTIYGDEGGDTLLGGDGEDIIDGGADNDIIYGENGTDTITGGLGDDIIYGDASSGSTAPGDDILDGGEGDDTLYGGQGNDTYHYNAGNDAIADEYYGTELSDQLVLAPAIQYSDLSFSRDMSDLLDLVIDVAGYGTITLERQMGNNGVVGSSLYYGVETLVLGNGSTYDLYALDGVSITGTSGNDAIETYGDHDVILGGDGNDSITSNQGNDRIEGQGGNDSLQGGTGDDVYVFSGTFGQDIITENVGEGVDKIVFTDLNASDIRFWADTSNYLYIEALNSSEQVRIKKSWNSTNGSMISDRVELVEFADGTIWDLRTSLTIDGTASGETLYGTDVHDTMNGLGGNDTLYGYAGDDTLVGGLGNDSLNGGLGHDTYIISMSDGDDLVTENPDQGFDRIVFTDLASTDVSSWTDNSYYYIHNNTTGEETRVRSSLGQGVNVGSRVEEIEFSDGIIWDLRQGVIINNALSTTGTYLYGSSGNDMIIGGSGNDRLYAYDGANVLNGGQGNDNLYTTAGNNIFVFEAGFGQDYINLFGETDLIDFSSHAAINSLSDLTFSISSDDTIITFDVSNTIRVNGTSTFTWDDSYFIWDAVNGTSSGDVLYGDSANNAINGDGGDDRLYGYDGRDVLRGGDGEDTLNGGAGDDILWGGAGNDTSLYGSNGNDLIYGEDGNDYINGGAGDDEIYGGSGNDTILASFGNDIVYGGSGNDEIKGHQGEDTLYGGAGEDILRGLSGHDVIYGQEDNDDINGGGGDDIIEGGTGNDTIYGGFGDDIIHGGDGNDIIRGEEGKDTLYGDAGDDDIRGGHDDNILYGGDGDDNLVGGYNDQDTYATNDLMYGGAGDDDLLGLSGDDILDGGDGNDFYRGGDDNDVYIVSSGTDRIRDEDTNGDGVNGIDTILFGANVDANDLTFSDYSTYDTLITHAGGTIEVDYQRIGGAVWHIELLEFDDGFTLPFNQITSWSLGDATAQNLSGDAANNTILGYGGIDTINGLAGNDTIHGGDGDDTINGGDNQDTMHGGAGADSVNGDSGNDTLWGGDGDDILNGGTGDDVFWYAYTDGQDTISDTDGNDTIKFYDETRLEDLSFADTGTADVTITLKSATSQQLIIVNQRSGLASDVLDTILFTDGFSLNFARYTNWIIGANGYAPVDTDETILGTASADTLRGYGGADEIHGGAGADTLYGGDGDDHIHGGAGDDYRLLGEAGNDTIWGGAGNDDLRGGTGVDILYGGDGNDYFEGDEDGDTIYGEEGNDIIRGDDGLDTLYGGAGEDDIRGGNDNDVIYGGDGNDTWLGGDDGNDIIYGEFGNDRLVGGAGTDTLYGGSGDDDISGQEGDDILYGGNGDDKLEGGYIGTETYASNDHLYGEDGDDWLLGRLGDDYLYGGRGVDILEGGAGADRFIFEAGLASSDDGIDEIMDFSAGEGDIIDLSDLLSATYDPLTDTLSDFVSIADSDADGEAELMIDIDGTGTAHAFDTIAVFTNIASLDVLTLHTNGNLLV